MSNIIIGSMVICQILVSSNKIKDSEVNLKSTNLMIERIARNKSPNEIKSTINKESQIIVGEVTDIAESQNWKKNEKTGKFFQEDVTMLEIKSKEIDKFVVNANSCGLYDKYTKNPEEILNKIKKSEVKQKKTKVSTKTDTNEYLVVPLDYKIDESKFQVIEDPELRKAVKAELIKYYKEKYNIEFETDEEKNIREKKEEYLDQLAQNQKDIFIDSISESNDSVDNKKIDKEKPKVEVYQKTKERVETTKPFSDIKKNVEKEEPKSFAYSVFDEMEKEIEDKREKEEDNKKVAYVEKEVMKKSRTLSSKSLLKEALKIIITEW